MYQRLVDFGTDLKTKRELLTLGDCERILTRQAHGYQITPEQLFERILSLMDEAMEEGRLYNTKDHNCPRLRFLALCIGLSQDAMAELCMLESRSPSRKERQVFLTRQLQFFDYAEKVRGEGLAPPRVEEGAAPQENKLIPWRT